MLYVQLEYLISDERFQKQVILSRQKEGGALSDFSSSSRHSKEGFLLKAQ